MRDLGILAFAARIVGQFTAVIAVHGRESVTDSRLKRTKARTVMITVSLQMLMTFAASLITIEAIVRFGRPVDSRDLLLAITTGG